MPTEAAIARTFAERYAEARAHLRRLMESRGLHERGGWRIHERTRTTLRGLELVMTPVHLSLPTPDGIECVVEISGDEVHAECEPDTLPAGARSLAGRTDPGDSPAG